MSDRRDSISHDNYDAPDVTNNAESSLRISRQRSTSPAKRRASEMDHDDGLEDAAQMDVDHITTGVQDNGEETQSLLPISPSSSQSGERNSGKAATGDQDVVRDGQNGSSVEGSTSCTTPVSAQESAAATMSSSSVTIFNSDEDGKQPEQGPAIPSIDEQVQIVYQDLQGELVEGQAGVAISTTWLARVLARSSEAEHNGPFDKSTLEGEIGPIDNTTILHDIRDRALTDERGKSFFQLRPGLRFGEDIQVVPEETYSKIVHWYGLSPGQPVIWRYAHDTTPEGAETQNVQWELYPPIFTIRKLATDGSENIAQRINDRQLNAAQAVASRNELFQDFLKRIKTLLSIPMNVKVRLWRVIETEQPINSVEGGRNTSSMLSPPASRDPSPTRPQPLRLSIELKDFKIMTEGTQREMIDMKDHTMDEKYNGHAKNGTLGLAADQVLIVEPKFGDDIFASDTTRKTKATSLAPGKTDGTISQATSGRSSPAPYGIMTRGRLRGQGRPRGTVGLSNLGNTCYMNSALQCVRSVEELTLYFLEGKYKEELNPNNPLGHNGQIAKAYAGLVSSIYSEGLSSFTPKNFKQTLGKYGPMFSGYGQQDSQEFMSFLIDGLHEDLNRIQKKPYIENPESDDNTVNDPEAIKALGEKFRENDRARNDSVAMDLFNGFYKNTMVCPVCDKVSITFDPFSLLALQLPIEQTWQHTVDFIPLWGKPVKVDVDIDKNSTIRALKEYVAAKIPGLKANRLMMAEIFSSKFYRTCDDKQTISEANIQPKDEMVLFELEDVPTNFPAPKKKKKLRSMLSLSHDSDDDSDSNSPLADRMMVPIFHRALKRNNYSNSYSGSKDVTLWPSYVIINREEAKSIDEILRKVLGRVAVMTSRPFLEEDEVISREDPEADTVITTDEDASSNVDPNINARSVESEDDLVDVSMNDRPTPTSSGQQPRVLEPGAHISDTLRSLFEMKYLPAGPEMVPTGWQTIDPSKNYASLHSRLPRRPLRQQAQSSDVSSNQSPTATPGTSDMEDEAEFSNAQQSIETTSDHDSEPLETWSKPGSSLNRRKHGKNKRMITYGKRNNQMSRGGTGLRHSESTDEESGIEENRDENPALIRLCEGIILDWNRAAFDALFGGGDINGIRDYDTRRLAETIPDPELAAKRQRRTLRKKTGVTLDECFTESSKAEILTEGNDWYCNRCNELRLASKKLEIWTAPDILVIHLKRFSANRIFRDKVDVLVDFPVEGLDLSGKVDLTEGKDMIYDLIAVDNHYGGLGGGHYTAFAKNFFDSKWYEYNGMTSFLHPTPSSFSPLSTYTHTIL
jgi:ubiquitin carboxyl-terminal hydrolase 4/11/15